MIHAVRTLGLTALLASAAAVAAPPSPAALEAKFDASVSSADQMAWLKEFSSAPNHVGSPHDKANAERTLALFKEWGWDARIETFDILYPTPITTTVEMVAPQRLVLGGQEPALREDATSGNTAGALPPYVAFQGDGDVTAPLVYVNFGMPDDYLDLARRGIDVRGRIVLVRYGAGWRGLKPKLAQEHGAVGCIIYSDPAQDGYNSSDPYPRGGARPPTGVQRGSVVDMTTYPGDPLTPGIGATKDARRLTLETAPTILKIPVLPMSYGDAGKLLAALDGPFAPAAWHGGLPLAYHIGGSDTVKVHLAVKSDWSLKPAYDVIAVMRGRVAPDEWVVRGNHRDGWVFGASDPLSGHTALLSEAKALGSLAKAGWRPARTIVYASWDAEEPGLIGSTEWVEAHAAELQAKAVLYINTDTNGRGPLQAEGSHQWQHLVNAVAADVVDPESGKSVAARQRAEILTAAYDRGRVDPVELAAAQSGGDLPIAALGSGSDYSAFLQHLGVASLNLGYGGEDESGGVYHSIYDSYDHFLRFNDPGLKYGATMAKTVGRLVLRTADAETPPVRFGDFAATVARYLTEVKALADERRTRDRTLTRLIADDGFRAAGDPLKPVAAPVPLERTPRLDFGPLEDASDTLTASAARFDAALAKATPSPAVRAKLNTALRDIDQFLLNDRGLPTRPWFKNLVYAPGKFTGYGAKTLPGVREAIEERRFADARTFMTLTAAALMAFAGRLDSATALLK